MFVFHWSFSSPWATNYLFVWFLSLLFVRIMQCVIIWRLSLHNILLYLCYIHFDNQLLYWHEIQNNTWAPYRAENTVKSTLKNPHFTLRKINPTFFTCCLMKCICDPLVPLVSFPLKLKGYSFSWENICDMTSCYKRWKGM